MSSAGEEWEIAVGILISWLRCPSFLSSVGNPSSHTIIAINRLLQYLTQRNFYLHFNFTLHRVSLLQRFWPNTTMMLASLLSLFPIVAIPLSIHAASASGQGSVSLWADSGCTPGSTPNFGEKDPVALNYTLNADVCGNPGADSHSYIVNSRPICANGTVAAFAFYATSDCTLRSDAAYYEDMNHFNPSTKFDGECLAFVKFGSVASATSLNPSSKITNQSISLRGP